MMRIIAGSKKGHPLVAPHDPLTRPAAARVRESIFNILPPPHATTRVLDLFAGSGAVGLEALSRGAGFATFVDHSLLSAKAIQKNVVFLGFQSRVHVYATTIEKALRTLEQQGKAFDWIFLDPPYASPWTIQILGRLGKNNPLVSDSTVVITETSSAKSHALYTPAPQYGCLIRSDQRKYGQTVLSFYRKV